VKRFALFSALVVALAALSSAAAVAAATPDITGQWNIEQTGPNGTTASTISITQSGMTFVGSNPKNGTGFNGTFVNATQINGKWHGPGGAGWLTVFVSPNGHSFNGTWGYNGRASNGSFVGNKVEPPIKITTEGSWNVTTVQGSNYFNGPMTCKESGPTSVCDLSGITLNGKFRTDNKVRYTWTSKSQNGWFSFWFNNDGQSFNGQWGYGPDSSPPMGRVVGQRQGPPARQ
jgi:hypothetical protein